MSTRNDNSEEERRWPQTFRPFAGSGRPREMEVGDTPGGMCGHDCGGSLLAYDVDCVLNAMLMSKTSRGTLKIPVPLVNLTFSPCDGNNHVDPPACTTVEGRHIQEENYNPNLRESHVSSSSSRRSDCEYVLHVRICPDHEPRQPVA